MKHMLIFLSLSLLVFACSENTTKPKQDNNTPMTLAEILIYDMTPPHESKPHGVPENYNWAQGPRIGMGNNPGTWRAITAWGQLYEAAEGNPAKNTRVQLRNMSLYVLVKSTGEWKKLQSTATVEGGAYVEDFVDDINKPADIRPEATGGISTIAGDGFNFHFWPIDDRKAISPDIAGVVTVVESRLILADSTQADDRDTARFVLSVGADYWLSTTAQWDQLTTNGDVAIGKFKYVTTDWQIFTMCTASAQALRDNPPPIDFPIE